MPGMFVSEGNRSDMGGMGWSRGNLHGGEADLVKLGFDQCANPACSECPFIRAFSRFF